VCRQFEKRITGSRRARRRSLPAYSPCNCLRPPWPLWAKQSTASKMRPAVGCQSAGTSARASSDRSILSAMLLRQVLYRQAKLGHHLFHRDTLAPPFFKPSLRASQGLTLFLRHRLIVNGSLGDGSGNGIKHGFEEADDRRQLRGRQTIDQLVGVFLGIGSERVFPSLPIVIRAQKTSQSRLRHETQPSGQVARCLRRHLEHRSATVRAA
jgi:hypothetical protein